MTRVLFLDDHPAVRAGLRAIVATEPDLKAVGFASCAEELWPLLQRTRPDVIVLDAHHSGLDGLHLCLQIKRRLPAPAVVLYSASINTGILVAAAVAGAGAVVSKSSSNGALLEAIRAVARLRNALPAISLRMKAEAAARLDPADHAILAMRLADVPPVQIATTLGVSEAAIANRTDAIVATLTRSPSAPRPPVQPLSEAR
jgi:DNA-binding NarL/FixJ family response regulator